MAEKHQKPKYSYFFPFLPLNQLRKGKKQTNKQKKKTRVYLA